jgi:hypothetical protein
MIVYAPRAVRIQTIDNKAPPHNTLCEAHTLTVSRKKLKIRIQMKYIILWVT